jgi:uncharacterized membrane protein YfcA
VTALAPGLQNLLPTGRVSAEDGAPNDRLETAQKRSAELPVETVLILLLGLAIGIAVGLLGVGGGILLVPALSFLLGMNQHLAQGTSLFIQLPPLGLGALYAYWKRRQVDWRAGWTCALGFFLGGYFGSLIAIQIPAEDLRAIFGLFLMFAAAMLLRKSHPARPVNKNHA